MLNLSVNHFLGFFVIDMFAPLAEFDQKYRFYFIQPPKKAKYKWNAYSNECMIIFVCFIHRAELHRSIKCQINWSPFYSTSRDPPRTLMLLDIIYDWLARPHSEKGLILHLSMYFHLQISNMEIDTVLCWCLENIKFHRLRRVSRNGS